MKVALNHGREAEVQGWEERHRGCPNIGREVDRAREHDSGFLFMLRGTRHKPPYLKDTFVIGQKARAAYYRGDRPRLAGTPRRLSAQSSLFKKIAAAYARTRMADRSEADLVSYYEQLEPRERYLFAQLLIEGLHYQNCRPPVADLRDCLFVVSFTLHEAVALKYALDFRRNEDRPRNAWVLEYAPPKGGDYYRLAADVIRQFEEFNLGYIYRDRDREVFVWYAALPHYLLGYSQLVRDGETPDVYRVEFEPNPHYANGEATLDRPPDLNRLQREIIPRTVKELAWVRYDTEPESEGWWELRSADGTESLRPPEGAGPPADTPGGDR